MKCCWRSIYGIIIAIVKILLLIGAIIYLNIYLKELSDIEAKIVQEQNEKALKFITAERRAVIGVILLCVALIIICGLLIVGIVMRRHKLISPWKFLSVGGISIGCIFLIGTTLRDFFSDVSLSTVASNFFNVWFGIVISFFILLPVFELHLEIKSEQERSTVQVENNYKKNDFFI